MRRGRPAAARGRKGAEVEGAPDMWVPHVRERKRVERRRALGVTTRPGKYRTIA
jgi:hypothetical protein